MNIVFEKTLAFTGHRPNQLASYDYSHPQNLKMLLKLRAIIERYINKRGVDTFITGMALGIDMWSAQIILALKHKYPHIKLVCAIPCDKQWIKWNKKDVDLWYEIIEQADYVHYVSKEPYNHWCMHKRNQWMVDNANFVLAVWNGVENGGTWNCIEYALKRQRIVLQLHPKTFEAKFFKKYV